MRYVIARIIDHHRRAIAVPSTDQRQRDGNETNAAWSQPRVDQQVHCTIGRVLLLLLFIINDN